MDICVFIHETLFVRLYVCLSVIPSFPSDRVGKLLHNADKRMANTMEVHFERNNLQVELSRCRNNVDFIHLYFEKKDDRFHAISPTEHKSGGFEHKPLRLRFRQSMRIRVRIRVRVRLRLWLYIIMGMIIVTVHTTQNLNRDP